LLVRFHARKPTTEGVPQVFIQDLHTGLQEQRGTALGPSHLLFLDEAFADGFATKQLLAVARMRTLVVRW
jgi:hypothetical protein